jgi:hypothetical protein
MTATGRVRRLHSRSRCRRTTRTKRRRVSCNDRLWSHALLLLLFCVVVLCCCLLSERFRFRGAKERKTELSKRRDTFITSEMFLTLWDCVTTCALGHAARQRLRHPYDATQRNAPPQRLRHPMRFYDATQRSTTHFYTHHNLLYILSHSLQHQY